MKEIWKNIDGFVGVYQISNLGNVLSCKNGKEKLLSINNSNKYLKVILYKNNTKYCHYIHRLVATYFIPNPKNNPQVNHIDGIKSNNNSLNIEWCSASENICHAYKNGLKTPPYAQLGKSGIDHHNSKPITQFDLCGNLLSSYASIGEASRATGITSQYICKLLKNGAKNPKHIWKYNDINNK